MELHHPNDKYEDEWPTWSSANIPNNIKMNPYRMFLVLPLLIIACTAATAEDPQSKETSPAAPSASLNPVSPLGRQVFQRDSHDEASVLVSGSVPPETRVVEVMTELSPEAKRGREVGWTVLAEADGIKDDKFTSITYRLTLWKHDEPGNPSRTTRFRTCPNRGEDAATARATSRARSRVRV